MMSEPLSRSSTLQPLLSAGQIQSRVTELGRMISDDYAGRPLTCIVVLKGAFVFAADLLRSIEPALAVQVDFVRASSYGDLTAGSGKVQIHEPDPTLVAGQHIVLVEDILDTGGTLAALQRHLAALGPVSVDIATLLVKDRARSHSIQPKYVGFHIPDEFVVGYGLDRSQQFRHLPDIRVLDER